MIFCRDRSCQPPQIQIAHSAQRADHRTFGNCVFVPAAELGVPFVEHQACFPGRGGMGGRKKVLRRNHRGPGVAVQRAAHAGKVGVVLVAEKRLARTRVETIVPRSAIGLKLQVGPCGGPSQNRSQEYQQNRDRNIRSTFAKSRCKHEIRNKFKVQSPNIRNATDVFAY